MTPTRLTTALALLVTLTTAARADVIVPVPDPVGDNTPGSLLDITSVSAAASGGTLTFRVDFAGLISDPALGGGTYDVFGFIDIDADRSALTPSPAPDLSASRGVAAFGPGVDVYISLQSVVSYGNQVDLLDAATGNAVGQAPITYGPTWFAVAVPLGLLSPWTSDGLVNYGVIAVDGTPQVSDYAPNGGEFAVSQVLPADVGVPEPGTLLLLAAAGLTSLGLRQVGRRA